MQIVWTVLCVGWIASFVGVELYAYATGQLLLTDYVRAVTVAYPVVPWLTLAAVLLISTHLWFAWPWR